MFANSTRVAAACAWHAPRARAWVTTSEDSDRGRGHARRSTSSNLPPYYRVGVADERSNRTDRYILHGSGRIRSARPTRSDGCANVRRLLRFRRVCTTILRAGPGGWLRQNRLTGNYPQQAEASDAEGRVVSIHDRRCCDYRRETRIHVYFALNDSDYAPADTCGYGMGKRDRCSAYFRQSP